MQDKTSTRYFFTWILVIVVLITILMYVLYGSGQNPSHRISKCEMEIANLITALVGYRVEFGTFPSGDSVHIQKALSGENPKQIPFFRADPRSLNGKGELLDPWGTPYEIKLFSTNRVSVRSAGENRSFGVKDDVTSEQDFK